MLHTLDAQIETVTVFHRAALVTRAARLPAVAAQSSLDLCLADLPLALQDDSIRVTVIDAAGWSEARGDEDVQSGKIRFKKKPGWCVRNLLVEVDRRPEPRVDATSERADALEREQSEIEARLGAVCRQIDEVGAWLASPPPEDDDEEARPFHFESWDAFVESCDQRLAALHERRRALLLERHGKQAERERVLRLIEGDRSAERLQHLGKRVTFTIAPLDPSAQTPERIEISYIVPGARWTPVYRLYVSEGSGEARLVMGAQVAQRSGEDWPHVKLRLSAARLERVIQLPELPSRRIGRAQPPRPVGWRSKAPPSQGLFAGLDTWLGQRPALPPGDVDSVETLLDRCQATLSGVLNRSTGAPFPAMRPPGGTMELEAGYALPPEADAWSAPEPCPIPMPPPAPKACAPASAPMMAPRLLATAKKHGSLIGALGEAVAGMTQSMADTGSYEHAPEETPYEPPPALARDYLQYELVGVETVDVEYRGQLRIRRQVHVTERVGLEEREILEGIRQARGRSEDVSLAPADDAGFQCVYETQGRANVPADGHAHAVDVREAEAPSSLQYRTVPMVDPQVFRRLALRNPFGFPLPPGPVQIFLGGAYAFTTPLRGVGSGGEAVFPLGVEQRLKVARNTTFHQDERGLTGANTVATHGVEIELRSRMPDAVRVDVLERVPVADENEKKLEVRVTSSLPPAEAVAFVDEERARGMHRWRVDLEPGATAATRLEYAVTMPSKKEVVGGNRRA